MKLVLITFLALLTGYLVYQMRRPDRWIGQRVARAMNITHSALTDWGLTHVKIERSFKILDVGCGGGATVFKLASLAPDGIIQGIDYAPGSVAAARKFNAELIETGRVEIRLASVSRLPFADDTFDLVTAIETQYYWPDLVGDMREILRVLRSSGTLLIVAETYKGGRTDKYQRPIMKLLGAAHLDVAAHRQLFVSAGYKDIRVFEEKTKGWICVTGRKHSQEQTSS